MDTHLGWRPAAGEEVPVVVAMKRDVENAGVAVKHLLGAVAVVNILVRGNVSQTHRRRHISPVSSDHAGCSSGLTDTSYPVNNEDLADAELVLQLLGCYGDRVEVAETP